MNARLYWTLVAVAVTLAGLYVAAGWARTFARRVVREVGYYRKRRHPEPAFPLLSIAARPAWTRREALGAMVRGLIGR